MNTTTKRGFASMTPDRIKEIASKGGKAAHAKGVAHQFNSEEAKLAGRKGGLAPHVRRGRGPVVALPPPVEVPTELVNDLPPPSTVAPLSVGF